MSSVNSAVILVDWMKDTSILTQPVNFDEGHKDHHFQEISLDAAGGYKHMEIDAFAMALNYITGEDLEKWFKDLPWAKGDVVTLIWNKNGEGFNVVHQTPHRGGGSYSEHLKDG